VRSRAPIQFAGLVIPTFVAAALLLPHSPDALRELVLSVGPAAPLIAVAAWIVLTPVLFPGAVLAAACGLAFGAAGGAALAWVGALGGGMAAFALSRTVARSSLEPLLRRTERLAKVHALLARRGFAAVLAARLMPGVPAGGLHYVAGVSPVSARAFAAAMAIGALLRTVPYAVLGQGLGSGSLATILLATGSIVLGGLAAAVLVRHLRQPVDAVA
jgi:uncharacterized membrane protein YdjX (TVP38/TMEM64 family)